MIRNMQIRSKLIAVLVIPLVALTVLAALGIGANVARGLQADRVNDQTAFAVSLSTLVHELQRERDLSAGWVYAATYFGPEKANALVFPGAAVLSLGAAFYLAMLGLVAEVALSSERESARDIPTAWEVR